MTVELGSVRGDKRKALLEKRAKADRPFNVGDIVRYIGNDPRWAGQSGPVTSAEYDQYPDVPLVVKLPGGPNGIGICFRVVDVEAVEND